MEVATAESMLHEIKDVEKTIEEEKEKLLLAEELHEKLKKQGEVLSEVGEFEEEYISNKLITLLQNSKAEKEKLALQIEQEEEYLTNTLQKKLEQLKREKVEIEMQLEQEQEYIVNRLQIQLQETKHEKEALEKKIEDLSRLSLERTPPRSPSFPRAGSHQDRDSNTSLPPQSLARGRSSERGLGLRSSTREE